MLPEGLTFDTLTGEISGMPVSYKSSGFRLTITATNGAGEVSKSVKLTVKGTKPKITASLPNATVGQPYTATLSATGSQPITWTATNLPEGLSLNDETISGTPTGAAKSYKVKLVAKNPVKSVKKTVTLKVNAASAKSAPVTSQGDEDSHSFGEYSEMPEFELMPDLTLLNGYIIVAELGTISADETGMYEFDVVLNDDASEGAELLYLANADNPSEDDGIAEFYDDTGTETSVVPESRIITVSIWLNKGTTYSPVIAVK